MGWGDIKAIDHTQLAFGHVKNKNILYMEICIFDDAFKIGSLEYPYIIHKKQIHIHLPRG